MSLTDTLELSDPAEMRLPLLWIAILAGRTKASLAASTGVATSADVVKCLLAGADVVMTTSALLRDGIGYMRRWWTACGAGWRSGKSPRSTICAA